MKCDDDNVDKKSIIPCSLVAGLNMIDCGGGENYEIPLGLLPVCLSAEAKKIKVR